MEKSQNLTKQIQKTINNPISDKIKDWSKEIGNMIANTKKPNLDKNQISSDEDINENKLIQKRMIIL